MSLKEYKYFIDQILPSGEILVKDKERNKRNIILYTFLRLQQMFKYENLPETLPQRYLEFYLMSSGHCAIFHHEGNLYCAFGGFGGEPDEYYEPIDYIVANPYLKLFKTFKRGEDCVVMYNDSLHYGIFPLVSKYAALMAENELSMNIADINSRIMSIVTAQTDNEFTSALKYFEDIEKGKLGAVTNEPFFDGIKTQPYATSGQSIALTSLIEYEQYLKASLFNELGLNANYNMKRESINSNESQLNDDMLTPLIDDMLENRKRCIDDVNDMFGTDITVDFASAWKENEITTMIELEQEGNENDITADPDMDNSADNDPDASETEGADIPEDTEDETDDQGEEADLEEDPGEDQEIKEDLEDIKEDLKDIKEDIEKEDDENEEA